MTLSPLGKCCEAWTNLDMRMAWETFLDLLRLSKFVVPHYGRMGRVTEDYRHSTNCAYWHLDHPRQDINSFKQEGAISSSEERPAQRLIAPGGSGLRSDPIDKPKKDSCEQKRFAHRGCISNISPVKRARVGVHIASTPPAVMPISALVAELGTIAARSRGSIFSSSSSGCESEGPPSKDEYEATPLISNSVVSSARLAVPTLTVSEDGGRTGSRIVSPRGECGRPFV
ncbi:hypothetical protein AMTR_s00027p00139980 [Amborella trichopoda]|uniref:Uncharacterized protein n=1 Tax=Amborella trichopoda TaxID=13333 RepID=W1PTX9_AMBTC|nr:hypothetical protein AMTR_s00027p00139980 [Amborella trichopoda]